MNKYLNNKKITYKLDQLIEQTENRKWGRYGSLNFYLLILQILRPVWVAGYLHPIRILYKSLLQCEIALSPNLIFTI